MTDTNNPAAFPVSPIINQPWEDVADDVTGAIERAVQPLLKKATDDIYAGLIETTQDYLRDNLAFNIASRINVAEREASSAREEAADLRWRNGALCKALEALLAGVGHIGADGYYDGHMHRDEVLKARAALAAARGDAS